MGWKRSERDLALDPQLEGKDVQEQAKSIHFHTHSFHLLKNLFARPTMGGGFPEWCWRPRQVPCLGCGWKALTAWAWGPLHTVAFQSAHPLGVVIMKCSREGSLERCSAALNSGPASVAVFLSDCYMQLCIWHKLHSICTILGDAL